MEGWINVLAGLGVEVTAADRDHVTLCYQDAKCTFELVRRSRAPHPSEVHDDHDLADVLVVAPSLSANVQSRLARLGACWVTDSGQVRLHFPGHDMNVPGRPRHETLVATNKGPLLPLRGTGAFAILRRMLTNEPMSQAALARTAGLTQARVSQVLSVLTDTGLARQTAAGWDIADRDQARNAWLAQYPGPGGVTTYWSGLGDPWSHALAALEILPTEAVVSGDCGADILAPWRQPAEAVIYAPELRDLSPVGLVQVGTRAEASLVTCAPSDRTVWPDHAVASRFRGHDINIADPLQVLWDVLAEHGTDSEQAGRELERWLNQRVTTPR